VITARKVSRADPSSIAATAQQEERCVLSRAINPTARINVTRDHDQHMVTLSVEKLWQRLP